MDTRSTVELVTFHKSFALSTVEGIQPPGIYTVRREEEMLDTLSVAGWRLTGCTIQLYKRGAAECVDIDLQELREALVRDGDDGSVDPPMAALSTAGRSQRVRDFLRGRS
jgi:hypothetical protein